MQHAYSLKPLKKDLTTYNNLLHLIMTKFVYIQYHYNCTPIGMLKRKAPRNPKLKKKEKEKGEREK